MLPMTKLVAMTKNKQLASRGDWVQNNRALREAQLRVFPAVSVLSGIMFL